MPQPETLIATDEERQRMMREKRHARKRHGRERKGVDIHQDEYNKQIAEKKKNSYAKFLSEDIRTQV
jgi:hypothetical protein